MDHPTRYGIPGLVDASPEHPEGKRLEIARGEHVPRRVKDGAVPLGPHSSHASLVCDTDFQDEEAVVGQVIMQTVEEFSRSILVVEGRQHEDDIELLGR